VSWQYHRTSAHALPPSDTMLLVGSLVPHIQQDCTPAVRIVGKASRSSSVIVTLTSGSQSAASPASPGRTARTSPGKSGWLNNRPWAVWHASGRSVHVDCRVTWPTRPRLRLSRAARCGKLNRVGSAFAKAINDLDEAAFQALYGRCGQHDWAAAARDGG
jgi:hypothetical protein